MADKRNYYFIISFDSNSLLYWVKYASWKSKCWKFRFYREKLYSLSDETKTKLSDLNQDVTIQLINATNYRYLIDYAKNIQY